MNLDQSMMVIRKQKKKKPKVNYSRFRGEKNVAPRFFSLLS